MNTITIWTFKSFAYSSVKIQELLESDFNYVSLRVQCRYCGAPRLCNPFDQMSVGQAVIVVGLVETTMIAHVPGHDASSPYAWSLLWAGALVRIMPSSHRL